MNFAPGDDYLYSNTGYALLATIVGRATGMTFARFAQEQIFQPLGMSASQFGDDASKLVREERTATRGGRAANHASIHPAVSASARADCSRPYAIS